MSAKRLPTPTDNDLEVTWEREQLVTPESRWAVRLRYRVKGSRRWTRVLVVPNEGQALGEIVSHAHGIAAKHRDLVARRGRP